MNEVIRLFEVPNSIIDTTRENPVIVRCSQAITTFSVMVSVIAKGGDDKLPGIKE